MEIKIDVRPRPGNTILVNIRGKIGSETIDDFKKELEKIIDEGHINIIMSLKEVTYINSMGLGVLASLLRKVKKDSGDIKIYGAPAGILDLLKLTRLIKQAGVISYGFEVYENEEDALKAF